MPARRPQTAVAPTRPPPRASRDHSTPRHTTGGARRPSHGRTHAAQNRSASLQDGSRAGRPPRSTRAATQDDQINDGVSPHQQLVQDDVQQREQQIEQVLAALSSEDRRIFKLMSGVLVRQPVVQAHRVLACLAYQSETRRYLDQYGGVGSSHRAEKDGAGDDDDDDALDGDAKASLLRDLEASHAKAAARQDAAAQRAERETRRADWVRANTQQKKQRSQPPPQQQHGAAAGKREASRGASSGRGRSDGTPRTAANGGRQQTKAVLPLGAAAVAAAAAPAAATRADSVSSSHSSQASTNSPLAGHQAVTAHALVSPPKQTPPPPPPPPQQTQSPPKAVAPQLAPAPAPAVATPPVSAPSQPTIELSDEGNNTNGAPEDLAATASMPPDGRHEVFAIHTALPAPTGNLVAPTGPSAPEPSASTRASEQVSESSHGKGAAADVVANDNITDWLFNDRNSAPATHAHVPASHDEVDYLFGEDANDGVAGDAADAAASDAIAMPEAKAGEPEAEMEVQPEEEEEEEMFVPGAARADGYAPAEEPVDDVVPEVEDMKMPWDDI